MKPGPPAPGAGGIAANSPSGAGQSASSTLAVSHSFLSSVPAETLSLVLAGSREEVFAAEASVHRQGQQPSAALILSGLIRVFVTAPDGRQMTVRYAHTGDLVGSPLDSAPEQLSAQALNASKLLVLDLPVLLSLARSDAQVGWPMSEELGERLNELVAQLALNTFGTLRQRVVHNLLSLAAGQQESGDRLTAHMSQQQLADAVGSVREAVARVLSDLRRAGLIQTRPLAITLLKPAKLEAEGRLSASIAR